jgi:tetratricopeptide (TPR) repeat protein
MTEQKAPPAKPDRKSPARRHFERTMAAQQSASAAEAAAPGTKGEASGNQYELMKAALIEDRRRLHDIQSIQRKIELKKELLPQYAEYIQGVMDGDSGLQDDVLMTILVWHLDVGDIAAAVPLARYALRHGINPPDQYQRTTAAIVAEEASDTVLRLAPDMESAEAAEMAGHLRAIEEMTRTHDMHDQIRAKLFKALGYACRQCGDEQEAVGYLEKALSLNEKIGVKKDIEQLQRSLKKGTGG